MTTGLANELATSGPQQVRRRGPLWAGPCGEGPQGGVTNSLLSRWLCCRERFRALVVEGLRAQDSFSHRLEYGNMWHLCEEAHASEVAHFGERVGTTLTEDKLREYTSELHRRYPMQGEQIDHWADVCRLQFPIYAEHWSRHPDVRARTPLLQEVAFDVPIRLPSGRVVRLRGKWDSVDLIGEGKDAGIWLQENKTKGEVDEQQLTRQLTFDLQTMLYLVALIEADKTPGSWIDNGKWVPRRPVLGVRYNVVRRPLSGGRGSIVRHVATKGTKCGPCQGTGMKGKLTCLKCQGRGRVGAKPPEAREAYLARLAEVIRGASGSEWGVGQEENWFFRRWKVGISQADVEMFMRTCLVPMLENLCDDWEWWHHCHESDKLRKSVNLHPGLLWDGEQRHKYHPHHCPRHFRMPFGVWNPLAEGRGTDLDHWLATGSEVGLQRTETLFPELDEAKKGA